MGNRVLRLACHADCDRLTPRISPMRRTRSSMSNGLYTNDVRTAPGLKQVLSLLLGNGPGREKENQCQGAGKSGKACGAVRESIDLVAGSSKPPSYHVPNLGVIVRDQDVSLPNLRLHFLSRNGACCRTDSFRVFGIDTGWACELEIRLR